MDLTVLIITRNADDTLGKTLQSIDGWAGSVIIIDDYSTDLTNKIAQTYKCQIISHHSYDLGKQRAFALSNVKSEWTLVLDSDEVLTSENKKEIEVVLKNSPHDGYYLRFRNHLFGKKLNQGELHKKLVLFRTKKASIQVKEIHEKYEVEGKVGELYTEVLHYSYRSVWQIVNKFFSYSIRQAKEYKRIKKKYGLRELILNPPHMFYSRFLQDKGYRDGLRRIFLDISFAAMEFLSYALVPFVKTKKRVAIDCGPYAVGDTVQSGIDRLLQGMFSQASEEYDYYWYSFAPTSSHRLPRRFFSFIWLPLTIMLNRCDVFMGTAGNIPAFLSFFPIKKILFLHDFGFFSSPKQYDSSATRLQRQTEDSIRRADTIVVFHDEIYNEFIERYPEFCYKAVVIPAGADHLNYIQEKPVFIQPQKPMALFVGVVKPVKRVELLLRAIGDAYCVIAGPHEDAYMKSLKIGENQHVQFIKNFNDGQLKWLYKNAHVMVYTSEHEGFCYPVLEALAMGLPVIAMDIPIFKEYKKYFPHLTLVPTIEELKNELKNIGEKKKLAPMPHPYQWKKFNVALNSIWSYQNMASLINKKFAFIIVLFKNSELEKKQLEDEIENLGITHYEIYWIDNTSNQKGYAAGVNVGIRRGLRDKCDEFIVLNPDVSLKNITADTLFKIGERFDVWGFCMRQNKNLYYGGEIDSWRLSGGLINMKPSTRYVIVDFISGSLMGFSRRVVQETGLWDEKYFMYYEDVDYCERARKVGFSIGIDTEVIYDHFEVSQKNEQKKKWIASSRWKFFWKYANWKQMVREMVRLPKTISER